MQKKIAVLGSTGSVGAQSLAVCRARGYRVRALTAYSDIKLLERQAREFLPRYVAIGDPSRYSELKTALAGLNIRIGAGSEAVCEAAALQDCDIVVNSIVGIAGLRPTLAALGAGRKLALANKEALIAGGELVMKTARENKTRVYTVDSEHSAIWQCLEAGRRKDVRGVILTASGGPFFGYSAEQLKDVTVEQALRHPNWSMGGKITVDCATLMNKGLEFIEAMWLFDLEPSQIEVVVHRQSIVHSAVDFVDGAVIAQLGVPDMRTAIQYALTYPRRLSLDTKRLSLTDYGSLTFEKPDLDTFICLRTCMQAARQGGLSPCIANGANEMAVSLFRGGWIGFLQIGELVQDTVEHFAGLAPAASLTDIEDADRAAREYVRSKVYAKADKTREIRA
ncbi:MAG: 1-deoxy-D-xylulose-5-phosphate reductoisomerase [Oscillospiraceae bacterium]|nr:1-deoxy-D-xylulose-5-phosphate reductoisomerase [Oscillospiraceae bacterium]